MSLPKAQLVDPQGNMNLPGMTATGVVTATSLKGDIAGTATALTGNPDLDVGIVTASSFVGQGDGHAANITGTPQLNLGITTATSFVGDATGKAAGLTGTPNLNVGLITATSFVGFVTGDVTGNVTGNVEGNIVGDVTGDITGNITGNIQGDVEGDVTGNVSGLAGALGINGINVWTGAGTSNLGVGVCTATILYGDGSALVGAGASAYIAQQVTATGAETIIDLSYGNVIYYNSSSNTTVGFASTSAAEQITFIRDTSNSYTITWPDSVKWNNGTTPTLINNPRTSTAQVFRFTTADTGLSYNAWEEIKNNSTAIEIWQWGRNSQGRLGLNQGYPALNAVSSPTQLPGTNWRSLNGPYDGSGANMHSTKTDGTLWSWGANTSGALGLNQPNFSASSPIQVGTGTNWKQASSGYRFGLAVKTDGTMWSWGYGERGNLANNATGYYNMRSSPIQVPGTNWSRVMGNGNSSSGFKSDGSLWFWGLGNSSGGYGRNDRTNRSSPAQLPGTWDHTATFGTGFCKKTDGTWWAWGYNAQGQLGQNSVIYRSSPVQLPGTWAQIDRSRSVLGVKTDGTLWVWGDDASLGLLGLNQPGNTKYSSPVQIGTDTDWSSNVGAVSGGRGGGMAACIKTDGTLWMWGKNQFGSLGQNQTQTEVTALSSPTQVPGVYMEIQPTNMEQYGVTSLRGV